MGRMSEVNAEPATPVVPVRYVDDVDTLRALSDPLRLAILNLLMSSAHLRTGMTAKEIAGELEQPQTRLYRHLKHLVAADLVQVAGTRLVSGIVEHTYRAAQRSVRIEEGFLGGQAVLDDALRTFGAALDRHRDDLFRAIRAGRARIGVTGDENSPPSTVAALDARIAPGLVRSFAERLAALVAEFAEAESDPDGVPTAMVITYYTTDDPR